MRSARLPYHIWGGQAATYEELVRALGEPRAAGERGGRALLAGALPRLAQLEGAPASLAPALLQLARAGDDRCGACPDRLHAGRQHTRRLHASTLQQHILCSLRQCVLSACFEGLPVTSCSVLLPAYVD